MRKKPRVLMIYEGKKVTTEKGSTPWKMRGHITQPPPPPHIQP